MLDLETMHDVNERAYREWQEESEQDLVSLPLAVLAERLTLGPPSLSALIGLLESAKYMSVFLDLVKEYLPEHKRQIMTGPVDKRIERFVNYFNQQYFPLSDSAVDMTLEEFVSRLPVDPCGIGYDDYHNLNMRDGITMMMSLVQYPYVDVEPCSRGMFPGVQEGRVPLLEEVAGWVGKELVAELPEAGFSQEELHKLVDKTEYATLALCADWVFQSTDLSLLDCPNEEGYEEPVWEGELIDMLTKQWPQAQEFWKKVIDMAEWLEKSPDHYRELVHALVGKHRIPKEQLPLPLDIEGQPKPQTLMEIFKEKEVSNEELVRAVSF